jgi:hypothetical protein
MITKKLGGLYTGGSGWPVLQVPGSNEHDGRCEGLTTSACASFRTGIASVAVASPNAAIRANIISVVFIVIVESTRDRYKYINTYI